MSPTRSLIEFGIETSLEKVPPDAILMAKRCILDCIGVTLAGSRHPLAEMLCSYVGRVDTVAEATILGVGKKASCPNAALANGALAHVLDFDDTSSSLRSHPSAPVTAALLSVGESRQLSGRRLLEAFIVGFETECKLGAAVNPQLFDNGWHAMGPVGRVGSVMAVSKLLQLDREKMENALALACATASGIACVFGTSAKAMNSGLAAEAGVRSALFAEEGLTGPEAILERDGGFCDVFAGKYELSELDRLGKPFDLIRPGVSFKQYPSCTGTHAAIDATLAIREEHGVRPDDVDQIECRAGPLIPRLLVYPIPKNGLEAKFSMEYCVSAALVRGKVDIESFEDEAVTDPEVTKLMRRVIVVPDRELEMERHLQGVVIIVRDRFGKRFEKKVNEAKGNPSNPLSDDELERKFMTCASTCLDARTSRKLSDLIWNLEKVETIREITDCAH